MSLLSEPTAVEEFARFADAALLESGNPETSGLDGHKVAAAASREARYRALLPTSTPQPGQQYRFEVDLDSCTGCKACVAACHSLNGLDPAESWRSVGLLIGTEADQPGWSQHVTTACHHCVEPACLIGCPVEAYEKDPITGIVAHLDDQCIGCRYCMLMCPYEVPCFNHRLGIVRKCDMCTGRLAVGEAPACVQGCPTDAISIGLVSMVEISARAAVDPESRLVPTAPLSAISSPTTVYRTGRTTPEGVAAADDHHVVPAADHPPLVAMLVLTQLSVGAFLIAALLRPWIGGDPSIHTSTTMLAWGSALVALAASVAHLGRPLVAWRAVIGLRHSWLSREILAFGLYAPLATATALSSAAVLPRRWTLALAGVAAITGLFGVTCSALLYAATRRPLWRLDRTAARFGFTMAGTGGTSVALASGVAGHDPTGARLGASVAVVGLAGGLVLAAGFLVRHRGRPSALGRSVRLMSDALATRTRRSVALCSVALAACSIGLALPFGGSANLAWAVAWMGAVGGAWLERSLFFRAASPDRMPGTQKSGTQK